MVNPLHIYEVDYIYIKLVEVTGIEPVSESLYTYKLLRVQYLFIHSLVLVINTKLILGSYLNTHYLNSKDNFVSRIIDAYITPTA